MSLNVIALIGVGGILIYALTTKYIPDDEQKKKNTGTRLVGQSCAQNYECSNKLIVPSSQGGDLFSAVGCCDSVCKVRKQGDILGEYTCRKPEDPKPDIERMAEYYLYGKKQYLFADTKEAGSPCKRDSDCGKYGMPHNAPSDGTEIGCHNNVCTFKKRDYAGNLFWPETCKGKIDANHGTCNENSNRTEAEIKYREWWNMGKIDNTGLQPQYKPELTREEIMKYFL